LSDGIPKLRWGIGLLLGMGVLINYFDRISLSVAAPQLQLEFGLSEDQLGWLFSGFFWPYALLQIPRDPETRGHRCPISADRHPD
jgi:ACS family D-galactonate transporter-like MFS transporter